MKKYSKQITRFFVQTLISGAALAICVFAALGQSATPPAATDKAAQADAISAEAISLFEKGTAESLKAAEPKFEAAQKLYRETGSDAGVAYCLVFLGRISFSAGDMQKALDLYNQAVPLLKIIDDKSGLAVTLNNIGAVYRETGDKHKSLDFYAQALPIYAALGDKNGEATERNNIGLLYDELGEGQKALELYNEALPFFVSAGNIAGQATTLNNIGKHYSNAGDIQKSLEFYGQALPLHKAAGNKGGEAGTLINIGSAYAVLNDQQKALVFYLQALPPMKEIGDNNGLGTLVNNIGGSFNDLGEKQKAFDFFGQALAIFRAAGNKGGEASALDNIGLIYLGSDERPKALEYFNQALPLYKAVGDPEGEATILTNIGSFFYSTGDTAKALDYFNRSLPVYRSIGSQRGEALTLNNIGGVYDDLGDTRKALVNYTRALPIYVAIGTKSGEAVTLNNLMYLYIRLENRRLAIFYGKQAVDKYGEVRQNNRDLDKRTQQIYLKTVEKTYRKLAEILILEDRLPEALQVLNAFKDQQFFDFDRSKAKQAAPLTRTPLEARLSSDYQNGGQNVATVQKLLDDGKVNLGARMPNEVDTAKIRKLEGDRDAALAAFNDYFGQAAKAALAENGPTKTGPIADVTEMQSILRELSRQTGETTAAVYQLSGEDNFHALVITADTISKVSVPADKTKLNEQALQFWTLLQNDRYDPIGLAGDIYKTVFKPIEPLLPKDTKTILWSLDGNLRYVPMAALYDGTRYLVERYQNVIFTRVDKERMTRNVSRVWTGTAFGTTKPQTVSLLGETSNFIGLPGVADELKQIFRTRNKDTGILNGEVLSDEKFNQAAMLAALKQRRPLVHIASHFSFRPGDEDRSFLLMGDGTAFTLGDMKRQTDMFAGVELLTLSACNTAAQRADANGREVDGFAELAQRLGAGAVMATLWQVSDASTPRLMTDFYSARQAKTGVTKAEALQTAQISLLNGTARLNAPNGGKRSDPIALDDSQPSLKPYVSDPAKPFAHPHYWAPFVLIGNSK